MKQLYFAYGANMSADVLGQRMLRDSATFSRRRAILGDHRLLFDKLSSTDPEVGYANVSPAAGHAVEGTLNEFDDDALAQLDAIELVPHHYRREQKLVMDSSSGKMIAAHVYVASSAWVRPGLRPLRGYLERLLAGADQLSAEYVAFLRAVRCRDDVDVQSH